MIKMFLIAISLIGTVLVVTKMWEGKESNIEASPSPVLSPSISPSPIPSPSLAPSEVPAASILPVPSVGARGSEREWERDDD